MQTEDPWATGTERHAPLSAFLDYRHSSDAIVPSEIFSQPSDMSLGFPGQQQSHLHGAVSLHQPADVFGSRTLPQDVAGQRPVLQGVPITGHSAAYRPSSTLQQPSRPLELLPEHLQSDPFRPGPSSFRAPSERQPFAFAARRPTSSLHEPDTHDGSSSTGSRNSPQVPLRSQVATASGRPVHSSPRFTGALRGRSYSTSAIPRGAISSRVNSFAAG